jgi:hypothetical protein
MIFFKRGADAWQRSAMTLDATAKTLVVKDQTLQFEERDGKLVLSGTWEGKALELTLQKLEDKDQPLVARGFHWVQEFPFNR